MVIHKYKIDDRDFYKVHVKDRTRFGVQINRTRSGITSEAKAKRVELNLRMELKAIKERRSSYVWEDWLTECLDRMSLEFKNSTVINYEKNLNKWVTPHFKGWRLEDVKKRDIHDIIFKKTTNVSDNTRETLLKQIRRVFNIAIDDQLITFNPAKGIKVKVAKVKKKCLNSEEVKILLTEAFRIDHPFRYIWAVALMTGLRSGELYALKWSDVDLENNYISINQSWTSKNGFGPTKNYDNRSVPISSELSLLLKRIKLSSSLNEEFVLPRLKSWRFGEQASILREFCKDIGITEIAFHDLRATFITQMLIKDVPVAKVMKIVGHSNIKTTMVYLRLIAKDVEGATEALDIKIPDFNYSDNILKFE